MTTSFIGRAALAALVCAAGFTGAAVSSEAQAQAKFPVKPIRLVVPFGAGGATHTLGRLFAEEMSKALGQNVVVTAVPGSGGAIGAAQVARARPDGYTLLMGSNGTNGTRWQTSETGYDLDSFVTLGAVASLPTGWAVRTNDEIKTMKDLIAHVKANPGTNYASVGTGSSLHIATEELADKAGIQLTHVAARGGKEAIVKLLSGEVRFIAIAANNFPGQRSKGEEGEFRGLAVTAPYPFTSDLPTLDSIGYKVTDVTWWGPFAPAGTPEPVLKTLKGAVETAAKSDNFQSVLKKFHYVGNFLPADEAARDLADYAQRMEGALKKIGMHKSLAKN